MNYLIYTPDLKRHQLCQSQHEVYMTVREWLPKNDLRHYLIVHDMQNRETSAWHRTEEGLLKVEEL